MLECSEVLIMEGAKMVEGPMLGEGLPEEKHQEPYYDGE